VLTIRILPNKTKYTNKKFLPVWLYIAITHILLVAGDFFLNTWIFTPYPKNIICKFLTNILRGYISSRRELHYSKISKALTFTGASLGTLFYFCIFWKIVFKNLNLGFGELYIILSQTKMFQPNWSVFYLHLKDCYFVVIQTIYYSLSQGCLDL
jgi:hypothetical protein